MERNKVIILKIGIPFLIALLIAVFSMKKGDEQNAVTEMQEKVEEGNLTGFYVQKETKELHISQVNVDTGIEQISIIASEDWYD